MEQPSQSEMLRELHDDLGRKWKTHATTIQNAWRFFDRNQRTRCLKVGAMEGKVLKHSADVSLGNVYKIIPEWNLRDITEPGSDFLLDLLEYRATTSLYKQYASGPNGAPGDHAFILEMMRTKNLRYIDDFKDCYTFFTPKGDEYGKSYHLVSHHEETLAAFAPAMQARICIPQSTGELILQRQITLLQSLNIMIEDILDEASSSRKKKDRQKKSDKAATATFARLSLQFPAQKMALPDLVAIARDQQEAVEEYLGLFSTEPDVLSHVVNVCFFTRPELIADEKGRQLPVHTDKYISPAFFEAIHRTIQSAAIWKYIFRLLELLETSSSDKVYRAILLQEISNLCHMEYDRAQAVFKRYIQAHAGSKWFKRVSSAFDKAGNARVNMKGNPEELTRSDPQLHYMLRLCQPETNPTKAIDWIQKLGDLHEAHPMEREKLMDTDWDALCDLAIIVGLIQSLSSTVSMPPISRKKGQTFLSRFQELDAELRPLKGDIDLRKFAVPIDNLLEPGMADGALNALDQFVLEKTGTKMGFLYHDLVEECLNSLEVQYQQAKAKKDQSSQPKPVPTAPEPPEKRVEERRQKEKTRPPQSSAFDLVPPSEPVPTEAPQTPSQKFVVSASTEKVFSTLFNKSRSRGSVSWTAFESAMVELGFSIMPKFGSVYTLQPPESMAVKRPFTIHRPHKSRIEGYLIPIFARRLKRVYGWGEQTLRVS